MGTRNLTKVIDKDGIVRVAQYGQWDGYPEGQGVTALYHAHNADRIEAGLARCGFITEDEANNFNKTIAFHADNFSLMYPNLSRDTGADILGVVAYSIGDVALIDNSDFENDDLFCEGVYTIDFQKGLFISKFGKVVEFSLSTLPTKEQYLDAFRA